MKHLEQYELISNLGGNAWSGFHYAALKIALIATAGTYGTDSSTDAGGDHDSISSEDSPSSASSPTSTSSQSD